ncbi:LytR/AlgR family response regulator transcription factor [Nonlabens ponticola]|uniref:Response regulator transcription factor n=1 Tax=Nonlabens ponticola TaxID=2496866 RepID=A0A3S9MX44_9FLAO|nr:LytTR family DNA-binding domain-containing protein [Nonlabens ponticola]AZQ43717.1 response regulator transcription factor [Nonlabens ponticola]
MIHVVIVDDESHARSFLTNLLAKELGDQFYLVDSCASVKDAVATIKNNKVDLVFLDIQMPEEDGFELMGYFDEIDFEIIFVTAYDQYAIKAFNCSALHYLLKPLDPEKVKEAVNRFKKTSESKKAILKKFDVLEEYLERQQEKKRIVFNTSSGFDVVVLKEIMHIEAAGNYCQIHLKDQPKKLITSSMKAIMECLPDSHFCRIHDKYIVNLNEVSCFINADKEVQLRNGTELKVSERKLKFFKSQIGEMA